MTSNITAVTQDNLPLRVSQEYAYRILILEETKRKADESRVADVIVVSTEPIYSDLDMTMGIVDRPKSYASFVPPDHFFDLRRNPFTPYSVGPSFGSMEQRAAYERAIASTTCATTQDQSEKSILLSGMQTLNKLGSWVRDVSNNMCRFLQG